MRYLLLGAGPVQDRALRQLVEVAPELPGDLYGLGFARGQIATWQRRQAAWSALLGPLPEARVVGIAVGHPQPEHRGPLHGPKAVGGALPVPRPDSRPGPPAAENLLSLAASSRYLAQAK